LTYLFDKYQLDAENFSLTRHGARIPLEPKALRVLLLFVSNQGKLLEKNAIIQAVWPDTFVEESTLTRAVALVRKQLGDDPRRPVFIETVPTLGYRFITPVETKSAVQDDPKAPNSVDEIAPPARLWSRRLFIWTAIILIAPGVWLRLSVDRREALPGKRTIVLADFTNATGDSVFDTTLRQGMIVQLEQSPILTVVSEQRVQQILRFMNRPADTKITAPLAREICERNGGAAVLAGSIARLGQRYIIGLQATNCATGETIDTEQVDASRIEDVLWALGKTATGFRTRVGESLASMSAHDTPLTEATTSSLDALKAYGEANRVDLSNGTAAIPLFQRAIALDSTFAMAHVMLGRLYSDLGQGVFAADSTSEAFRLRERVSDRERFFIEVSYAMQVTGNMEKALETCETWARVYPRDPAPLALSAGTMLRVFGRYDEGVSWAKKVIEMEPELAIAYHLLVVNELALGRINDAQDSLKMASARNLYIPQFELDKYRLAFLRRYEDQTNQLLRTVIGHPVAEDLVSGQESSALAFTGHLDEARRLSNHAVSLAEQSGSNEAAARWESGIAIREALFGNFDAANKHAAASVGLSKGRDSEFGASFAFALAMSSSRAKTLADDLDKRFSEDTNARFHYLPPVRALLALNENKAAKAIDILQASAPYELGSPPSSFYSGFYGALYAVYVRGCAYLALNRGAEAALEFRKIIDHPGITGSDPIGVLAHLQLGRSYAQAGDQTTARACYTDFLRLWKTGDPNIPIFKMAQRELTHIKISGRSGRAPE
jgi:DNA-binding winged helix-turn-helix (wHTH) protein/tetratricopeptide (TPR) repeat protein/TolB-like protein